MDKLSLQSENLIIRNLRIDDLDDFHHYRSDPSVVKYQGFDVFTVAEAEEFINSQKEKTFGVPGEWVQFAIENKKSGRLIGDCAIRLAGTDPGLAEIGITISHLHQRKGYAREALKCILAFLFEERDIRRVVETVDAENEASISLLKSTGFRQEGYFVENVFFKGKWGSELQFAMLKREWLKISKS